MQLLAALTSALDGRQWSTSNSPIYTQGGKNRYALKRRGDWVGLWTFRRSQKSLVPAGSLTLDRAACSLFSMLPLDGCRVAVQKICAAVKYCRSLLADIRVFHVVSSGAMALRSHSISIVCVLLTFTLTLGSDNVFRTASCRYVYCIL